MIVVHNPTDTSVKDFPIQNPQSKETLLWNILPGETLEFDDYVAVVLLDIYGFLQRVITEDQYKEEKKEEQKVKQGKTYDQVKIIAAEGEQTTPPSPQTGFTNENMQPHGEEIAIPEATAVGGATNYTFICPEKTCAKTFKQQSHLKIHYGLKHMEMPL